MAQRRFCLKKTPGPVGSGIEDLEINCAIKVSSTSDLLSSLKKRETFARSGPPMINGRAETTSGEDRKSSVATWTR